MPIAFACSAGRGNIVTIMPRITAEVMAPPMPCTKRAPMSISWVWATPHSSEAAVKTPRPARNTPRREIRSPRRPASSRRPPNAIRYAFTTQARLDCEKPSSLWIDGSATFTTVASRTIISIPTHSTTSATQRERSVSVAVISSISWSSWAVCSEDRTARGNSSLLLPEGQLAARGRRDDAAPAGGALARRQQHRGPQRAGALRRLADLGDLHVRQPERPRRGALDDAAAQPVSQREREVRAVARVDALRRPVAEPVVERARTPEVAGVQLQVDDGV